MKASKLLYAVLTIGLIITIFAISSCNGEDSKVAQTQGRPLNISVFVDLSDRIKNDKVPNQIERDTDLINTLIDKFISESVNGGKLLKSRNRFNIFFYPSPPNGTVMTLAKGLNVDLAKLQGAAKKQALIKMKETIDTNLAQIYSLAIKANKFDGCDIWGFFTNKRVDNLCIEYGYRNILVILTDGYIYHEQNKKQDGTSYSYISRTNIDKPGTSLIVGRSGLADLEVLVLEISPEKVSQESVMQSIIENWLKGMGVKHYLVAPTGLSNETKNYIDNFLK